jgi:hypothetical protein
MSTIIKNWLDQHLTIKQWLWFIGLWFAGLLAVSMVTYPLKLLIKLAS